MSIFRILCGSVRVKIIIPAKYTKELTQRIIDFGINRRYVNTHKTTEDEAKRAKIRNPVGYITVAVLVSTKQKKGLDDIKAKFISFIGEDKVRKIEEIKSRKEKVVGEKKQVSISSEEVRQGVEKIRAKKLASVIRKRTARDSRHHT